MQQLLRNISILFFLFSCQSTDKKQTATTYSAKNIQPHTDFKKLDTIIFFAGYWVNEEYIKDIQQNKSPLKAKIPMASCFIIPKKTLQITRIVGGFHDGAGDWVVLKNNDKYQFWDSELKKKQEDITPISKDKIRYNGEDFIRIKSYDFNHPDDGPMIVEEFLFAGNYKDANGNMVQFKANGQVTGLDPFDTYTTYIDNADQDVSVDRITLKSGGSTEKDFGFRFSGNKLFIYDLKCIAFDKNDGSCIDYAFDKLKFTLVKID